MKNLLKLKLIFITFLILLNCGGKKADEAETREAKSIDTATAEKDKNSLIRYNADIDASKIKWKGSKIVGESHPGNIRLKDGYIAVNDNTIVKGNFKIDMQSLKTTDQKLLENKKKQKKLETHLKSDEFFNTKKYPFAYFEISDVSKIKEANYNETGYSTKNPTHSITGNLTIKDSTKSIAFPAKITMKGKDSIRTQAKFSIDRTKWGINYGSKESLGDVAKNKIIDDKIELQFDIKVSKK